MVTTYLYHQHLINKKNITMETQEIIQTIKDLFAGVDELNWGKVENTLSEKVWIDYSSMTGGSPSLQTAREIMDTWAGFLPGFDKTDHRLSDFDISVDGNTAVAHFAGIADHFLNNDVWTPEGTYDAELQKKNNRWRFTKLKFNFVKQEGNANLPALAGEVVKAQKSIRAEKVKFQSEGLTLSGNLFFPPNYDSKKRYPAVVVSGSWTTVKEQMAGLYAKRLAQAGFITLAFDFRNFGESEGQPKFYESPALKKTDIQNAVTFLSNRPDVDPERIGAFGVCAGAMYTLMAASEDKRIRSVVTAASWLHDPEAVKLFYGGAEGVENRINAGLASKKKFSDTGEVDYVPTISDTDASAAMFGPYDYYLNPKRGAIPQWSADKFAVMSWIDWLTTNPMGSAEKLTAPTLMIHSDGAVLPEYTKNYFSRIATADKKLHWMKTDLPSPFHQFNYYDQEPEVREVVREATKWLNVKFSFINN